MDTDTILLNWTFKLWSFFNDYPLTFIFEMHFNIQYTLTATYQVIFFVYTWLKYAYCSGVNFVD